MLKDIIIFRINHVIIIKSRIIVIDFVDVFSDIVSIKCNLCYIG